MPRHPRLAPIRRLVVSLGLILALSGCADGPLGLARYNPVLIDEWKQDEKYGASFHKRLEEMQEWERRGSNLPAAQQMQISQELNELVRSEQNVVLVAQAVRTQAALPQEAALESLRFATTHPQAEVRVAACRAWGRKGGNEAAETLARVLGSDTDVDVRVEAARELKRFPSPAAVQSLGVALDDPNPALQHRCVESLKVVTGKNFGEDVRAWREYVASGQAQPSPATSIADRVFNVFR